MKALVLVDIQNDFLPGGSLAVKDGDKIISVVNRLQENFDFIVASKDWHPAEHKSFAEQHEGKNIGDVIELNKLQQVLWPVHCVQDTLGSEFPKDLSTKKIRKIFYKGTDCNIDSYSSFLDNDKKHETGLKNFLVENGIKELYIVGLATDYCVKFTALDAVHFGFKVNVIKDACRGVNLKSSDTESALLEMMNNNINIIESSKLL